MAKNYCGCTLRYPSIICIILCMVLVVVELIYFGENLAVDKDNLIKMTRGIFNKKMTEHVSFSAYGEFKKTERIKQTTIREQKVILLWTGFWGNRLWNMKRGEHFNNNLCHFGESCIITTDKRMIKEADAVVFHCADKFRWPAIRYPSQIYTVFCVESPSLYTLGKFSKRINMTATYRLDSDLPIHYYTMIPKKNVTDVLYVPRYNLKEKTKSVVWASSNCRPASRRIQYINKLAEYIDVDGYGKCGNLKCLPRRSSNCYSTFEKHYKFYLSFENAICKDYVTEKLFNILERELIPVVLGGANYSYHAPEHSYINVMDFCSPKHLAEFLHKLGKNETAYNEYFQYKTEYYVQSGRLEKFFCDLCTILQGGNYRRTSNRDIATWWSKGTCNNTYVPKLLAKLPSIA